MCRRDGCLKWLVVVALLAGCASTKYSPLVSELKPIPGVSVKVSHQTDGIYEVQIHNNSRDNIALLWNGSAYVNTGGNAVRLIQIQNINDFPQGVPLVQAPSIITRASSLTTWFVGESWIDYARRGVTPRPKDSEGKAGIYLGFNIKGKKVYWKGEVSFVPASQE